MIQIFSTETVETLKSQVGINLPKYQEDSQWATGLEIPTNLEIIPHLQLDPAKKLDAVNAEELHRGLKISRVHAGDERLWATLAHREYWAYMRSRWKVENAQSDESYVKSHYFFGQDHWLLRNGISRLWWFAESVYMPEDKNPYKYLPIIMGAQDISVQLLGRSFGTSRHILLGFLDFIEKEKHNCKRDHLRALTKLLNIHGGSTLLDFMSQEEVTKYLLDTFNTQCRPFITQDEQPIA